MKRNLIVSGAGAVLLLMVLVVLFRQRPAASANSVRIANDRGLWTVSPPADSGTHMTLVVSTNAPAKK
jgi:hypothetical protein